MSEWIDLTQTLAEDSPTLPPLHPKPEFEDYATLDEDDRSEESRVGKEC